jgi:hypothetical protein
MNAVGEFLSSCFPIAPYVEALQCSLMAAFQGPTEPECHARIQFLPEDHNSSSQRQKNGAYLSTHYNFARGDIVLVEDDSTKGRERLNAIQLGTFAAQPNVSIEGWDDHASCLEHSKVAHQFDLIQAKIAAARSSSSAEAVVDAWRYLHGIAHQVRLKEWEGESSTDRRLRVMEEYVVQARNALAFRNFEVRQKVLAEKIGECFARTEGVIYVMVGIKHLEISDAKVGKFAQQLLSSLPGGSYQIVSL